MLSDISTFGLVHSAVSLLALVAGIVVVGGVFASRRVPLWTAAYLALALAASLTGSKFLAGGFGPAHGLTIASTLVVLVAFLARYVFHLNGVWRRVYAAAAVGGVYFLVFFTIAESFRRVPALHAMAPPLTEAPFKAAQLAVLVVFTALAIAAALLFKDPGRSGRAA